MEVNIDDLEMAVEFVSGCPSFDPEAFLDRETGQIFYSGVDVDEELPADVLENERYISIPSKSDLDLGRSVVLAFTEQELPNEVDSVYDFFRRKGAYSKFRSLLERTEKLDKWYAFEATAAKSAIEQWCREQGLTGKSR